MIHIFLLANSILFFLAAIFLIIALGHAILAWSWGLFWIALVIFLIILAVEFVLSLYA